MDGKTCVPETFLNHAYQWKLRSLLQKLFINPDPFRITEEITEFLRKHPIPLDDFPRIKGTYTRTILFRDKNGYEAMAARWSKGALSPIHGHPFFTLYFVAAGQLSIDNFKKYQGRIKKTDSEILSISQFFASTGKAQKFDNHIHQVKADEESLSFHVSSDDGRKGEIFSQGVLS